VNRRRIYGSFLELAEKNIGVVVGSSTASLGGRGRREGDSKGMPAA
jgi:hypothetical protein